MFAEAPAESQPVWCWWQLGMWRFHRGPLFSDPGSSSPAGQEVVQPAPTPTPAVLRASAWTASDGHWSAAGDHCGGCMLEESWGSADLRPCACVSAVRCRPIVHSKLFCAPVWNARLNAPLPTTRPRWFEVCSGCEQPPTCRDLVRVIK